MYIFRLKAPRLPGSWMPAEPREMTALPSVLFLKL